MIIEIAELRIKITIKQESVKTDFIKRYDGYFSDSDKFDYQLIITEKENSGLKESYGDWPTIVKEKNDTISISSIGTQGTFNIKEKIGTVFLEKNADINIFDNFFRVLLAYLLGINNGFLLHSAGISDSKNGYIFLGHSNAGKSTISSFAPKNVEIFSDDIVILKKNKDNWSMFTSPFHGEETLFLRSNKSVPVKKIFMLKQSKENKIESVSKGKSAAFLLSCVPFISPDGQTYQKVWSNIIKLNEEKNIKNLYFKKGEEVWKLILS